MELPRHLKQSLIYPLPLIWRRKQKQLTTHIELILLPDGKKKSSGIRFSDLPFEMTYSVIIPKREEWSSNDNKPFRIMVLIIFTEGLDMEDGAG